MQDITFVISKLLWWPLRPGTAAILLALLGLALLWRGRRWGRWPALAGIGFLGLLALLPLDQPVLRPLEDRFPRPAMEPAHIDGIVVLGGAVEQRLTEARGLPALNGAAERMTEPVALLRRHPEARLVFTGGTASLAPGALSEADVARQLWLDLGVPAERMVFEGESRNTHENAVNTFRLGPAEAWRDLAADHLGQPHAAQHGSVPQGRLADHRLAGELPHRGGQRGLAGDILPGPAAGIRMGNQGVARPVRLLVDGPDGRAFPGAVIGRVAAPRHDRAWVCGAARVTRPQQPMPIPLALPRLPPAARALPPRPARRPDVARSRVRRRVDALAAAGDRAAFGLLVERHGERALRVALRVLGDGAEAEEVAQEAFLRAWQAAASFDPDRAQFTTWLHRITLNLAIDRTRRRGSAPDAGEAALSALADPAPGPEAAAAAAQDRAALAAALGLLPARQRAAIALAYEEGLSGAEAAAALDVSERALEGLLRRARLMLRRILSP